MRTVEDLVTDEQLEYAWGNADFGHNDKRGLIANTLLKSASGFSTGSTARHITVSLGLTDSRFELTRLGRSYLWAAYSKGVSL